jgi:hypothetical protein
VTLFARIAFVALLAASAAPALAQKPAAPPAAVKAEFDVFLQEFRAALKANDAAAVAGLTRLPFMAESDAAKFRAKDYPRLFDAKARACLARGKPVYDLDGEKNHAYSMFCGQTIYVFTRDAAGFRFTDVGVND